MNHDDYVEKMTDSIFLPPDAQIAHHAAVLRDILAELELIEKRLEVHAKWILDCEKRIDVIENGIIGVGIIKGVDVKLDAINVRLAEAARQMEAREEQR